MKKRYIAMIAATAVAVTACASLYTVYGERYLPETSINGISVSNMPYEEAKQAIEDNYLQEHQSVFVRSRGGKKYIIDLTTIDMKAELATELLEEENKASRLHLKGDEMTSDIKVSFDWDKLNHQIKEVILDDPDMHINPESAYIKKGDEGFEIIPETEGSSLKDPDLVVSLIADGIEHGENQLEITDAYYKKATVTKDNKELNRKYDKLNRIANTDITFNLRGSTKAFDWSVFHDWVNDEGNIFSDGIIEWVEALAKQTDTAYTSRTFTVRGNEYTVRGPYGFQIDREATVEKIISALQNGTQMECEPVYKMTAKNENQELGNVFVEVDLTNQHVYLHKDGEVIAESDCVTGTATNSERITPPGIFPITYKEKNATLKGPGYSSFVNYWMPFNGGIGLHDATWRGSFGGTIYKYSGSHGCVNLPLSFAKTVYENVEQGTAVLVHD